MCFFSVCVLEASVSQHTDTSFFQGLISPPSAQLSLLCSPRQTHPFLSCASPRFFAVGASLPLILSSLPMSSCSDAQFRAGVSSWTLARAPRPPAAPVPPLPRSSDWSERSLFPSGTSHLPHSLTFRFKDTQAVSLQCLAGYSANTPVRMIQVGCLCIFSPWFRASLFQPIFIFGGIFNSFQLPI